MVRYGDASMKGCAGSAAAYTTVLPRRSPYAMMVKMIRVYLGPVVHLTENIMRFIE